MPVRTSLRYAAIGLVTVLAGAGPATRPTGYGEVVQRTLNPNASSTDRWLDLDTGKLHDWPADSPTPKEGASLEQSVAPLREKGIDLIDDANGIMLECVVVPTSKHWWEIIPDGRQLQMLQEAKAGTFTFLYVDDARKDGMYYLFRTREGAMGILHLIGHEHRDQGPMPLKLEYRLLK